MATASTSQADPARGADELRGSAVLGAPLAAYMVEHPAVEIEPDAQRCAPRSDRRRLRSRATRRQPRRQQRLLARTIAPIPTSVIASPAYLDRLR